MKHINNKGLSNLIIISICLVLITIFSIGGYLVYSRNKVNNNAQNIVNNNNTTTPSTPISNKYKTDIIFEASDNFEELRQRISIERQEILDSIEGDLYSKWEPLNLDPSDELLKNYKISKYRLMSLRYLKNDNFEVALAGRITYVAKDQSSTAIPNGSGAECLHSKSTKPNSKWSLIKCYQNPVDCKDLDKLGLNYKQTVEWSCFDYEKQIERK